MAHEVTIVSGSVEYVYANVRADRPLSTQAVSLAVTTDRHPTTWKSAEWTGKAGNVRSARILLDGTLPPATYNVFARITDYPEAPVLLVGRLKIV